MHPQILRDRAFLTYFRIICMGTRPVFAYTVLQMSVTIA